MWGKRWVSQINRKRHALGRCNGSKTFSVCMDSSEAATVEGCVWGAVSQYPRTVQLDTPDNFPTGYVRGKTEDNFGTGPLENFPGVTIFRGGGGMTLTLSFHTEENKWRATTTATRGDNFFVLQFNLTIGCFDASRRWLRKMKIDEILECPRGARLGNGGDGFRGAFGNRRQWRGVNLRMKNVVLTRSKHRVRSTKRAFGPSSTIPNLRNPVSTAQKLGPIGLRVRSLGNPLHTGTLPLHWPVGPPAMGQPGWGVMVCHGHRSSHPPHLGIGRGGLRGAFTRRRGCRSLYMLKYSCCKSYPLKRNGSTSMPRVSIRTEGGDKIHRGIGRLWSNPGGPFERNGWLKRMFVSNGGHSALNADCRSKPSLCPKIFLVILCIFGEGAFSSRRETRGGRHFETMYSGIPFRVSFNTIYFYIMRKPDADIKLCGMLRNRKS